MKQKVKMKIYIPIIAGLITASTLNAQDKNHYLNATIGGGSHSLLYDLQGGDVKGGFGAAFNLEYSFFFNPNWGIGAGLGLQSAQAKGTLNLATAENTIDTDGDAYEFRTNFADWQEKQKALFLEIPIALQYQRWLSEKNGLLASAGGKIAIPVSSSYEVVSGSRTTSGYYQQWNVELKDMPQHGFATMYDRPSNDLKLKTSFALFAELGWLHKMSEKLDLYAGGYVSYGLRNLSNSASEPLYAANGTYNGLLKSYHTDKVNLLTVGIKIGLRLRTTCKKTQKIPAAEPVLVEQPSPVIEEPKPAPDTIAKKEPVVEPVIEAKTEPKVSLPDSIAKAQSIANQIDLKFPLNSAVPLNDAFDSTFTKVAQILITNPELKVRIQGHTCNLASREYNLKVSEQRAEVGKNKLLKMGVPASQIILESKAFDEPLVPNTNEKNRAKNRRITLIIE